MAILGEIIHVNPNDDIRGFLPGDLVKRRTPLYFLPTDLKEIGIVVAIIDIGDDSPILRVLWNEMNN